MLAQQNKAKKAGGVSDNSRPSTTDTSRSPRRRVSHLPSAPRPSSSRSAQKPKAEKKPLAMANVNGVRPGGPPMRLPPDMGPVDVPPIDEAKFRAMFPEVEDVPLSYLREMYEGTSQQFLRGLYRSRINVPKTKGPVPPELEVVLSDRAAVVPTHILVLSSSDPNAGEHKNLTYAIHSVIYAINCSRLPELPPAGSTPTSDNFMLPTVRVATPSPETFGMLSTYIYEKNFERMRSCLVPPNWATDMDAIRKTITTVRGVWLNALRFGVVDKSLYEGLEDVWQEVLRAVSQLTAPVS
ncbi:hypothetical protein CPC08DRAFT_711555 [Agrocybe pediades]|nr:hypothetical protein CPC08DRAFT_711555 [Agrocybe pediades]